MTHISGPAGMLFVDDGGDGADGAPVVFVHSLAGQAGQWAAQLTHLRGRRRAVALELRGHGRSDAPRDGDYAIASLAADVAAVQQALGLERVVLVGHSLGGTVALACAAAQPATVAGLLLVDPNGDLSLVPAGERAEFVRAFEAPGFSRTHWIRITEGGTAAVRAAVLRDLEATPPATLVQSIKALAAYRPVPALARYGGPRLSLISALNENPIGLHRLAPDLPYRLVPGTGHWIHMDRPEEFNRLMDGFLARIAGS
ncbi:MAG TPA: alpha/beta fold hydrolase [Gemmatimonadales bacterium]|jgi:pimeloyl-ACP methyl ester carboxylesterase|nr:alpha/beta fold hydrolase [Gemmatimonadales bacterium]